MNTILINLSMLIKNPSTQRKENNKPPALIQRLSFGPHTIGRIKKDKLQQCAWPEVLRLQDNATHPETRVN